VLHGGVENRPALFNSFLEKGGILLVTDVAARGLNLGDELSGVDYVVQYEMPNSIEQYVHRAGRAGRMG
jgi:superfamily II DNA/RNA helicase